MHALFENKCGTKTTKQFLPLQSTRTKQSGHLVKDGHRLNKTLKPLLTHSLTGRGHWARANQQGTKSERWAATHKSGTGQVPKRIVTWRWHKVRRLGRDKITRKITGSKQLRWMAASEQLRRAPKVSTAARYFSTTITIFPPTSHFKRIIWSFTFRALHRPITIANFCSAEKKIISISIFCQASRITSIEECKHQKTWKLPTSRVKKKIYWVFSNFRFFCLVIPHVGVVKPPS